MAMCMQPAGNLTGRSVTKGVVKGPTFVAEASRGQLGGMETCNSQECFTTSSSGLRDRLRLREIAQQLAGEATL